MKKLLLAAALLLGSLGMAYGSHPDAAKPGDTPAVLSWCKTVEDTRAAMRLAHSADKDGPDAYIKFMLADDNSCVDVRVMRMIGMPAQPMPMEVIEVVETMEVAHDLVVELVRGSTRIGERFSWHFRRVREA